MVPAMTVDTIVGATQVMTAAAAFVMACLACAFASR